MAKDIKKSIKPLAISLRKKGFSYSEIQKEIYVPKSTLSSWLRRVKLTDAQLKNLNEKKNKAARRGSQTKIANTRKAIEEIQRSSAADIKNISPRELWLMGTMLYWRGRILNKNENNLRKGVHFSSSDPHLVRLFLKWLKEAGRLKSEEIDFDIFIIGSKKEEPEIKNKKKRIAVTYWSRITSFPKSSFVHIYFQENKPRRRRPGVKIRNRKTRILFGILKIRIKASSMLARQISGWIKGIQKILKLDT